MIYERIKKLREKQGYTQTELAKMLGVTRSCVRERLGNGHFRSLHAVASAAGADF